MTPAGEEYANEVETANAVFRRVGAQEPPEQESDDPALPEPEAPAPGATVSERPEPSVSGAVQPGETDETSTRLEEGARLAKAQAAARAKKTDNGVKGRKSQETVSTEISSLTEEIIDGPVRLGRGRPPGTKSKSISQN